MHFLRNFGIDSTLNSHSPYAYALNIHPSMHQIAYLELKNAKSSWCKKGKPPILQPINLNLLPPDVRKIHDVCGWGYPSPTLSALGRLPPSPVSLHIYSVNVYFPINFWIHNIPTSSPKVCNRSLTLNPQYAKTSLVCEWDTPSHTLAGYPPNSGHKSTPMVP